MCEIRRVAGGRWQVLFNCENGAKFDLVTGSLPKPLRESTCTGKEVNKVYFSARRHRFFSLRISLSRLSRRFSEFLSWHSQSVMTDHPCLRKSFLVSLSLSVLRNNFVVQKDRLDFGRVARLQSGCWCQKHPLINTTFLRRGKMMSGLPGRFFACNRNL